MPFLTLMTITARNANGESITHPPQTVLSDWELEEYARQRILQGSDWYRARFEPLTDREAQEHRVRATLQEVPHIDEGGQVAPPWPDYVGLHPSEIIVRMKNTSPEEARAARRYEGARDGGMKREPIIAFVHPAERLPFQGYDDMDLGGILEKLAIVSDDTVNDIKAYERAHGNRPAIVEWDREIEAAVA